MKTSTLGTIIIVIGVLGLLTALGLNFWLLLVGGVFLWFGLRVIVLNNDDVPAAKVKAFLVPSDGAATATVKVDHAMGRLLLGHGSTPNALVEGRCTQGVRTQASRRSDDVNVSVDTDRSWFPRLLVPWQWHPYNWNIGLQKGLPLTVAVEGGMGEIQLDFSQLLLRHLRLEYGMGKADITLPSNAGQTTVDVETGMSAVDIRVPEGVAARITFSGFGANDVNTIRFPDQGGYFQSADYESAENRVEIRVQHGLSSVSVR